MIPIVLFLTAIILGCHAAPATYDQQQEGELNVQANLENFLFVFLTKRSWLNEITLLDFTSMAKQLVGQKESLEDDNHRWNRRDTEENEPITWLEDEELAEKNKFSDKKDHQNETLESGTESGVKIPKDEEISSDVHEKEQNQLENKEKKDDGESDQKHLESPRICSESS